MSSFVGQLEEGVKDHCAQSDTKSSSELSEGRNTTNDHLIRYCDVYENERFAPFLGFSARNLLPSDRNRFSGDDGLISFSTLEEVESSLLTPGWEWGDDEWLVGTVDKSSVGLADPAGHKESSGDWLYATDFSGPAGFSDTNIGSVVQKHVHFVRRRVRNRAMQFREHSVEETSTPFHCDVRVVGVLSVNLLDALCCLMPHTATRDGDLKPLLAKNRLVKFVVDLPAAQTLSVESIAQALDAYVQSQRPRSALLGARKPPGAVPGPDLAELFPLRERESLARLLISRQDAACEYHCTPSQCGEECPFESVLCTHEGCGLRVSRKWWAEHGDGCEFKIVPCALDCGCSLPRRSVELHMSSECPLRPVSCPFAAIGCTAEGLLHRDLAGHTQDAMALHLALCTERIQQLEANKRETDLLVQQLTAQVHIMHRR